MRLPRYPVFTCGYVRGVPQRAVQRVPLVRTLALWVLYTFVLAQCAVWLYRCTH